MRINGGNSGPIRPDAARPVRDAVADAPARNGSTPAGVRKDSVEISGAGRAKVAGSDPAVQGAPGRLAEIRQRVLQGAYDSDAVVAEVARRILDRGDL